MVRNYLLNVGRREEIYSNGTFSYTDPIDCSSQDPVSQECSLQQDNTSGFYESSSWEYSWSVSMLLRVNLLNKNNRYAPRDTAYLIELMGGNPTFGNRLDQFFHVCLFDAGLPSQTHLADLQGDIIWRETSLLSRLFETL